MTWAGYLFGFRGRVARSRFWFLVPVSAGVAIATLLSVPITRATLPQPAGTLTIGLFAIGLFFVFLFVAVAVCVKRLHDRNRSGWWLCAFLPQLAVAFLISPDGPWPLLGTGQVDRVIGWLYVPVTLWMLIELGFLRGTAGPNRFGEPPTASIADVFS